MTNQKRRITPSSLLAPFHLEKKSQARSTVAYFCMEYGIDQNLCIYSGGLGILAGDIIKTSVNGDLPLYGIGIFWDEGYTRQVLDPKHTTTVNKYPKTNRETLVSIPCDVKVTIEGEEIALHAYRVKTHKKLYLLEPKDKKHIAKYTSKLYQGGGEMRVAQEIILGIGGVRLLRELGLHIDVYHFNEGHAAFAGIELIKEKMHAKPPMSFEEAWTSSRSEIAFTTHTPVKAGNEEHGLDVIMKMSANNGLSKEQMEAIGGSPFGMTIAGLRLSYITNAVSQLHGRTAKKMWCDVTGSSSVVAITNGVDCKSWQNQELLAAHKAKKDIRSIHQTLKKRMIEDVKKRSKVELDPKKLIIGFARRSATYKRLNLIFTDMEKLGPLLKDKKVQMIFSGKAHPDDTQGREQIEKLLIVQKQYPTSIVFLENYDMEIGKSLTAGCDVWMNNPIRPQEASGTSGMKAAMNGVLNLSIADGWWAEGCVHGGNGWLVGEDSDEVKTDAEDAADLFKVLTEMVIPTFYDAPNKWTEMMNSSIETSTDRFSAVRMVNEYYEKVYSLGPVADGNVKKRRISA